MSRGQVWVRTAYASDADFLSDVWSPSLRSGDAVVHADDVRTIVAEAAEAADRRILIAEYDGQPAGAVYLLAGTVSPLNLEPSVRIVAPFVVADYRRKGVGHALFEAALAFADEIGASTMATVSNAGSREANRYFARLGLAPFTLTRVAPVERIAARLGATTAQGLPQRRISKRAEVMAARRSMRRVTATR